MADPVVAPAFSADVEISFTVTNSGQPYHKTVLTYSNMSYSTLVEIEQALHAGLGQLVAKGASRAKG